MSKHHGNGGRTPPEVNVVYGGNGSIPPTLIVPEGAVSRSREAILGGFMRARHPRTDSTGLDAHLLTAAEAIERLRPATAREDIASLRAGKPTDAVQRVLKNMLRDDPDLTDAERVGIKAVRAARFKSQETACKQP